MSPGNKISNGSRLDLESELKENPTDKLASDVNFLMRGIPVAYIFIVIIVGLFWYYLEFRLNTLDSKITDGDNHIKEIISLQHPNTRNDCKLQ